MVSKRFTDDELIEALRKHRGRMSRAARAVGCSLRTIQDRRLESPEVDEAALLAREEMVDKAEEALEELIDAKDFRAISFVLRTLGRDRGYVERTEIVSVSDDPLDQAAAEERRRRQRRDDGEDMETA